MPDIDFRELSNFRALIEGFAARCATRRVAANPSFVDGLREILKRIARAARRNDYLAFREADEQLHWAIMEMSGVPGLSDAWKIIWEKLAGYYQRGFYEGDPDVRTFIGEHEYLVEAIALCDPAAAEEAARSHIEANWVRREVAVCGKNAGRNSLYLASAYLTAHMQYPLRLDDMAAKVAFTSPGNLSRLFRQQYGVGFKAYLQRLRMTKAAELLESTNLPVSAITRRVGYRSPSLFAMHFHRHYRRRPGEWRKEKKQDCATRTGRQGRRPSVGGDGVL
ncbi:MAG: FCD domain-containing protein [Opitutaceae bacterium]|jgi:AraC-like DNA-binding protein|nr:FCD domain-containing protein [Opitutaceae bacterium]